MKIGVIIQARYGSTRLPGKVLLKIQEKSVLYHDIERIRQSKLIDEIVIATSNLRQDDKIEIESLKLGVTVFRGSETDVLSRYYYAAKKNKIDIIVRVTSDCPLIDPFILDQVIFEYKLNNPTIASNAPADEKQRTYPRGMDVEVFNFASLEQAFSEATEDYQREHVTPYIYEHAENIHIVKNDIDYSGYRLTLDTKDDFQVITKIYEKLYKGKHDFYLKDIVDFLKKRPDIASLNSGVIQKKLI